jgi:hypothetical protein
MARKVMELFRDIDSMVLQRNEEITWSDLKEEIILLDMEGGCFYTLNEISGEIWRRAGGGESVKEITRHIHSLYDAPVTKIRDDVVGIIGEFLEKNLVELKRREKSPGEKKKKPARKKDTA